MVDKISKDTVILWKGKDINALSKEELIDVIYWFNREKNELIVDRDRTMNSLEELTAWMNDKAAYNFYVELKDLFRLKALTEKALEDAIREATENP